jgi:WD40 repeat protein
MLLAVSLAALGAVLLACPSEREPQPPATAAMPAEAGKRVDQFGDPLPPGAVARLGTVRFRHGANIYSVAISPDGKMLASRGLDGAVRLWDTGSAKELARFDLPQAGTWTDTVAFSPDGRHAAAATQVAQVSMILIWDTADRKLVRRIDVQDASHHVATVAFARGGKTLAGSLGATILLWDAATGAELHRLRGHEGDVEVLAVSPDGKTLASGGRDGTVRLWDAVSGREVRRLPGKLALAQDFQHPAGFPFRQRGVLSLAFSPDGKLLAVSASGEKIFRVWETDTGNELPRFTGDAGEVTALQFLADGKTLVSGSGNGLLHLWDVAGRREIRSFRGQLSPVLALALSRDGRTLAVAGYRTVRLWEPTGTRELRPLPGHQEGVMRVAFSPDGKTVATGVGSYDQRVCVWDAASGKEIRQLQAPSGGIDLLLFSRDGKALVAGSAGNLAIHPRDAEGGGRFPLSPRGRLAVGANGKGGIRLWDTLKDAEVRLHDSPWWGGVGVSPAGQLLGCAEPDRDGIVRVRDRGTGREVSRCQGYSRTFSAFVFSPDGIYLAAAFHTEPRIWVVWEAATGRKVAEGRGGDYGTTFMVLAFSPDCKTLATGGWDGVVRLWEVATGGERGAFRGHLSAVRALAFSPDGKRLASGGDDTLGLVWDLADPGEGKRDAGSLWADLASADAAAAYRASRGLASQGAKGVALIERHLKPVAAVSAERLAELIAGLDGAQFAVRQKATRELEELADLAEPALRAALEKGVSLEVRRRAQGLLNKLTLARSPDRLRQFRAVETLELLATPEARRLLQRLAGGAPAALRTRAARTALERLGIK